MSGVPSLRTVIGLLAGANTGIGKEPCKIPDIPTMGFETMVDSLGV
jgi:hypothetical protein